MSEQLPRKVGADEEWDEDIVFDNHGGRDLVGEWGRRALADAPTEDPTETLRDALGDAPVRFWACPDRKDRPTDLARYLHVCHVNGLEPSESKVRAILSGEVPAPSPSPYEEMWRDMLGQRDALAATLDTVREEIDALGDVGRKAEVFRTLHRIREIVREEPGQ